MSDEDRETSSRVSLYVGLLLLVAAWLRLQGLDWDDGSHLHPDERFLTMVGSAISPPHTLAEYFYTARSPLNPGNRGYRFFVYGTLPLFLVRFVAGWLGMADYDHIHLVGRAVSAWFDIATVAIAFRIGRRVAGDRVGLATAALTAFSVTSIQNAHFFTVDSAAAFFAALTLLATLELARDGTVRWQAAFGAAFGLALGCRINLALAGALYPVAVLLAWRKRRLTFESVCFGGAVSLVACVLVFRVVQPYAFAGPGILRLVLARDFVFSMTQIRGLVTGAIDSPPSVQWIGRTPIVFPAWNLLVWGIGPAWGLAVLAGLVACLLRSPRENEEGGLGKIAIGWALLLFVYQGIQFSTTGRYFLPIVPVLALVVAWPLAAPGRNERWRGAVLAVVVGITAVWAFAFTAIYRRPVSRVEASRWIYRNVPAGSTLTADHWDDPLPLPLRDAPRIAYRILELRLYDYDTPQKRRELVDQLAEADYVIESSNRLYRSIPRAPWQYPMTRRYFELLFAGELGFRLEQSFTSYPRIGRLEIPDDEAEEAFTVYDHPHVLVFKKTETFSRDNVEQLLGAVPLTGIRGIAPRDASTLYRKRAPTDVPLPRQDGVRTAVEEREEGSIAALVRWMCALEALSLAAFVALFGAMRGTPDRGFGPAKIVAWMAPGYATWLLASTGLAVNTPATVRTITLALVIVALAIGWRRREAIAAFVREFRRELALIEVVFLVTFLFFLGCRALNPAIYWGEKPMDFAYLHAILRSRTMPPVDPWFAGGTLNYFYFGHAVVALFGELAGVSPELAFNLAIATVAALLAVGSCLVGRKISGTELGGVAAAMAVVFLGNLDGVRLLYQDVHRYLDFEYYWATSHVIAGTINEYPAWNLVFADLHAHVLAMPLEVTLAYLGLCWARERGAEAPSRWTVGALVAMLLGAIGATSAWSVPTAVGLQAAFLLTAWRSSDERRLSGLVGAAVTWFAVSVAARLAFLPFWMHYTAPVGRGIGSESGRAPVLDVLTVFGVFWLALAPFAFRALRATPRLVVAFAAALVLEIALLRSPAAGLFAATALVGVGAWIYEETFALRVIGLLVAVTGALGCGTEFFYVWDRVNTVFKYYLEAWLLLGCAAGAAFARCPPRSVTGRAVWWPMISAAAAGGVVTMVTGTIGFLRSPIVASDTPTLDGMDYLRHSRPAELSAYRWLSSEVEGVPVMLEAQGDPYGEFARVSMNTGLPTVLGWEYHLFQQAHSINRLHERRDDVSLLYSTTDVATGEALMRKYHVDLVFVGPLERRTYPAAGLAKFDEWGITRPVFTSGNVTIYARPGVLRSAKTWIEPVESASAEAARPLGAFAEPRDVARAPDGTLYVADFRNERIQHLGADVRPLGAFGNLGDAPGRFNDPCGVAVGPDGAVYVADTWNHRIQKFGAGGAFLDEWSAGFYGPRGIAVDRVGKVYVADTGNRRVVRLSADGIVEREWGKTELANPTGIAVDGHGEIYVADVDHRRVVVYDSDGRSLRDWPVDAWNPTGGLEPYLDVGPDGVVWLTDPLSNRVLLFDGKGHPLGTAAHAKALATPLGIAVFDATHAVVSNAGSYSLAVVWRTSSTSVPPER